MEARPKSRKVAWVVLGVVVVGAALPLASVWDQVWLKVAYIPAGPSIQIDDSRVVRGPFTKQPNTALILSFGPMLSAPLNAHSVQSYLSRFGWLPGPRSFCVFYDEAGDEVSRHTWSP